MTLLQWLVVALSACIISGEPTNRFRDCVAVEVSGRWGASGVLLGPNVVLTTGHSYREKTEKGQTGGFTHVFVGRDLTDPRSGEFVTVKRAIRHPDYRTKSVNLKGYRATVFQHDLALLILERGVDPRKASPARRATDQMIRDARRLRVVGFGANVLVDDLFPKGHGRKRWSTELPIVPVDPARYGYDPQFEFVAADPSNRVDASLGDAGAPAYVWQNSRWYLAAIVSRAVPPDEKTVKRSGYGSIYVRVAPHWDWIRRTAAANGGTLPR